MFQVLHLHPFFFIKVKNVTIFSMWIWHFTGLNSAYLILYPYQRCLDTLFPLKVLVHFSNNLVLITLGFVGDDKLNLSANKWLLKFNF